MSEKLKAPVHKTDKPWGYELLWAKTEKYVGKVLFVKKGEALSLQYHREKEETLFIESGECWIETGPNDKELTKTLYRSGDVFHIPPKTLHRLIAVTDTRIFEVSTPQLTDVIRLEDRYGRK